jgi:hypothetical protein
MARPGYLKARGIRDREYEWLEKAEERLAGVDLLQDSEGRPYSDALKEIHRRDATKAVEAHKEALARAQAAFDLAYPKLLARPKIRTKHFDVVLSIQLSLSKEMFAAIDQECAQKNIRKTDVLRNALEMYFPQVSTKEN